MHGHCELRPPIKQYPQQCDEECQQETKKSDGHLLHRTPDSSVRHGPACQDLEMGPFRLFSCLSIRLDGVARRKLYDDADASLWDCFSLDLCLRLQILELILDGWMMPSARLDINHLSCSSSENGKEDTKMNLVNWKVDKINSKRHETCTWR